MNSNKIIYSIKITAQELNWFYWWLLPDNFRLMDKDQQLMLVDILTRIVIQVDKKLEKIKRSCTLNFTPGESAAINFLYRFVYEPDFNPTNPVFTTGMMIRNELLRQSLNFQSQFSSLYNQNRQ